MDTTTRTPTETRRAIRRWIAQATLGWLGYAAILVAAAGRVDWVWGWVFIGIMAAVLAAHPLILIPINPDLLAERQQGIRAEGTKGWDRWLAPLAAGVFPMLSWITAGLDLRFGWSAGLPVIAHRAHRRPHRRGIGPCAVPLGNGVQCLLCRGRADPV